METQREHETSRLVREMIAGPWQLELATQDEIRTIALKCGDEVTIGSGPGADLRVSDRWVSAKHVLLRATNRGLSVTDLGSKNGVFVGSALVRSACLTAPYASFVIGRTTVCANPNGGQMPVEGVEPIDGLIGRSPAMLTLARDIRHSAKLSASVLLQGESGTGKDVVARALHELSGRKGEYVPLNVGGLSEGLADAELFGHRRGAFTGAHTARVGAFELADRGTLFLDEIAELNPSVQVKLLRVLEDGTVRALGADRGKRVDARVVSASWRSLEDMASRGEFRCDLFHRVAKMTLHIPPLRERRSDIVLLCGHLLRRYAGELGMKELSPAAVSKLIAYPWPGNVRELGSVLYRAAAIGRGDVVELGDVEAALPKVYRKRSALSQEEAARTLESYDGNVSAAARAAQVPRSTFRSWLPKSAG